MIVRPATEADIHAAFASLSPHSAAELQAAAAGNGMTVVEIEAGMIAARTGPGLLGFVALCEPSSDKPGALFIAARGEADQAEVCGLTTVYLPPIKRAFWLWFARRALPEYVDPFARQSHCSVVEGLDQWRAMLVRLGYREAGRYESGGRTFIDLVRLRPPHRLPQPSSV